METIAEFTRMKTAMNLTTAVELAKWGMKKGEYLKGLTQDEKVDLVCRVLEEIVKKELVDGPEKDLILVSLKSAISVDLASSSSLIMKWCAPYFSCLSSSNGSNGSIEQPSLLCNSSVDSVKPAEVEPALVLRSSQESETPAPNKTEEEPAHTTSL